MAILHWPAIPLITNQDDDGLWQLDLETGKERLLISTKTGSGLRSGSQ